MRRSNPQLALTKSLHSAGSGGPGMPSSQTNSNL